MYGKESLEAAERDAFIARVESLHNELDPAIKALVAAKFPPIKVTDSGKLDLRSAPALIARVAQQNALENVFSSSQAGGNLGGLFRSLGLGPL
jgi:hypothetical protein